MTKPDNKRRISSLGKQLKPAILQKIFKSRSDSTPAVQNAHNANRPSLQSSISVTGSVGSQEKRSKRFIKNVDRNSNASDLNLSSDANLSQHGGVNSKKKRESQVEKMRNRLSVGQFRYISEQLYTSSSEEASELFREKPELFFAYQRGYVKQQVSWPSNPLDAIISEIQQETKVIEECGGSGSPFVIADFGCGEARLARTVLSRKGNDENESSVSNPANVVIHSFDFVAANDHVVACDMAHTSLDNCSVDMVVFCLSLMGTNVTDFLIEANRVLKHGGRLRVAEVRSRFDSVAKFIKKLKKYGFKLTELRGSDVTSFFTHFTFVKNSPVKRASVDVKLMPCIYKKR